MINCTRILTSIIGMIFVRTANVQLQCAINMTNTTLALSPKSRLRNIFPLHWASASISLRTAQCTQRVSRVHLRQLWLVYLTASLGELLGLSPSVFSLVDCLYCPWDFHLLQIAWFLCRHVSYKGDSFLYIGNCFVFCYLNKHVNENWQEAQLSSCQLKSC